MALATGTAPADISFAGPGKSDADLQAAVSRRCHHQYGIRGRDGAYRRTGRGTGTRPLVSIRVNPDFELKTSGMKMAGGPKPFGVDAERVPAMLAELGTLPLEFMGFHIFCGSQNLRPEAIIEAQAKTFELAFRLAESAPGPVRWLNIGGGLGVPYFPGEQRLDLAPIAANLEPAAGHGQGAPARGGNRDGTGPLPGGRGRYLCV